MHAEKEVERLWGKQGRRTGTPRNPEAFMQALHEQERAWRPHFRLVCQIEDLKKELREAAGG